MFLAFDLQQSVLLPTLSKYLQLVLMIDAIKLCIVSEIKTLLDRYFKKIAVEKKFSDLKKAFARYFKL